jgi:hypothetical protein
MKRVLKAVVLMGSCLVAVVLFFSSAIFDGCSLPIELPPALSYRWFELTLTYPILGVALPLALVVLGLVVWSGKDGSGL